MAFYIKPPGGTEKLQNLLVFARKRLTFLKQVFSCGSSTAFRGLLALADTADSSECLIEGATKDRVSHFLLRFACCQDSEMTSFLVRAETELFCHRFASMNAAELVHLLKSTHRFLLRLCQRQAKRSWPSGDQSGRSSCRNICKNLLKVLQGMIAEGLTWTDVVNRYLDGCRSAVIHVPFQYALSLVASRSVVLERGVARVPPGDILKVLAFLFEELVSDGMVDARHSVRDIVAADERMVELFMEIRQLYYSGRRITGVEWAAESGSVTLHDIDNLSTRFPPCMQHLHRMLRKRHRLRHFSRIQYTLFLKEVGLPVSEAVKFWQREYSQPNCCHSDSAGCTHDWKRDGKRYTYSIRHLYGLEGSRINYRAHSCRSIQERSIGYGEEGGCPFSHFDGLHLQNIMSHSGITSELDKTNVIDLAERGKMQAACRTYFRKSVAVSLVGRLKSTQPGGDTGNSLEEKVIDEKVVDKGEIELHPCNKKRPRLGSGDLDDNEARVGNASMECVSGNGSNATKQNETLANDENLPRPETLTALQALVGGATSVDHDVAKTESLSAVSKDTIVPRGHLLMHPATSSSAIFRSLGDSNEDVHSACYDITGSSATAVNAYIMPTRHQQPMHKESSSRTGHKNVEVTKEDKPSGALTEKESPANIFCHSSYAISSKEYASMHQTCSPTTDSRRPSDSRGDAPSSQSITILRNIQIQKPVDYYRSYIQLLGSLEQLEGSNS